jgi:hypothetical protein
MGIRWETNLVHTFILLIFAQWKKNFNRTTSGIKTALWGKETDYKFLGG